MEREGALREIVGRYAIYDRIAAGGMAVVHIGRLLGQAGFARTVAVKRLHSQFAKDPGFVDMFLDEARLTARIQHPNVVAPLDVVTEDDQLLVVMEYVNGETLQQLIRVSWVASEPTHPSIIGSVIRDVLYGLAAAHQAVSEDCVPLHIVHRDISPQNIMVGLDGVARVLDFGVAKATMRSHATKDGEVKGKISYMSPEQLMGRDVDCRTDIFAAGVVLWEALTCRRLFRADDLAQTVHRVLSSEIPPTRIYNHSVSEALDAVVLRALERNPAHRFQTAREFAAAIEHAVVLSPPSEVGDWVRHLGGETLASRIRQVAAIESSSRHRLGGLPRPSEPELGDEEAAVPTVPAPPKDADLRLSAPDIRASLPSSTEAEAVMSASTGSPAIRRLPRVWAGVTIGALAAATLVTVGGMVGQGYGTSVSFDSAHPATSFATELNPIEDSTPVSRPAPADSATSPVPTTSTPVASVEPSASPGTAAPREPAANSMATSAVPITSRPAQRLRSVQRAPSVGPDCTPPYYLDEKRIRRIKPGCI